MTIVSNDPSWWPSISQHLFLSYWMVAAGSVIVYDWVLTLGQEIELIWRQRWSLMTVMYLIIRYIGLPYSFAIALQNMAMVSLTDAGCNIIDYAINGTNVVVTAMLGVIMIARLHAMYRRSTIMLIFTVIIFLTVNIACGAITAIGLEHIVEEELILSGTYMCTCKFEGDIQLLNSMVWMLYTVWEVLALCLSVWIAVEHFRDLRRAGPLTGSTIRDSFRVLIKSHALYFTSFVCVSCFEFGYFSLELSKWNSNSIGVEILSGAFQILYGVQLFVLGPRLILGVREFHATLGADSDAETTMTSIVLQEHVDVPTNSTV